MALFCVPVVKEAPASRSSPVARVRVALSSGALSGRICALVTLPLVPDGPEAPTRKVYERSPCSDAAAPPAPANDLPGDAGRLIVREGESAQLAPTPGGSVSIPTVDGTAGSPRARSSYARPR
ncbi:hypothetical protein [Streptomyces sp. NPDC058964]|uniref:hypothetical protein n=1 Tax=Streptomyces sp. NPDC058964 TaxID=3346681 RepID=UPI0036A2B262